MQIADVVTLTGVWTDGKMTIETLVEHESSRKSEILEPKVPEAAPATVHWPQ